MWIQGVHLKTCDSIKTTNTSNWLKLVHLTLHSISPFKVKLRQGRSCRNLEIHYYFCYKFLILWS